MCAESYSACFVTNCQGLSPLKNIVATDFRVLNCQNISPLKMAKRKMTRSCTRASSEPKSPSLSRFYRTTKDALSKSPKSTYMIIQTWKK